MRSANRAPVTRAVLRPGADTTRCRAEAATQPRTGGTATALRQLVDGGQLVPPPLPTGSSGVSVRQQVDSSHSYPRQPAARPGQRVEGVRQHRPDEPLRERLP